MSRLRRFAFVAVSLSAACTSLDSPSLERDGSAESVVADGSVGADGSSGADGSTAADGSTGMDAAISSDQDGESASGDSGMGGGSLMGTSGDSSMGTTGDSSVEPGAVETGAGMPCTGEGTIRCAAGSPGARQVCMAGMWAMSASCPSGQICQQKDGAAPTCQPVAEICQGSGGAAACDGQGTLISCNTDGTVAGQQTCGSAKLCQLGLTTKKCAVCVPNTEFKCTGTQLDVCAADGMSFVHKETCTSAALCNKVAGMCTTAVCAAGKVACSGNTLTECNTDGSAFKSQMVCPTGSTCDDVGNDCNTCEPGMKKCESGMVMTCAATGRSFTASSCSGSQHCVGAGQCAACGVNADCSAMTAGCKVGVCSTSNTCTTMNAATGTACTTSTNKAGTCSSGTCQCTPQCSGKECGDDGCGNPCPSRCSSSEKCSGTQCVDCTSNSDCKAGTCMVGSCSSSGTCSTKPASSGTSCTSGGKSGTCDGNGSCRYCGDGVVSNNEDCEPGEPGESTWTCSSSCKKLTLYTACFDNSQCASGQICAKPGWCTIPCTDAMTICPRAATLSATCPPSVGGCVASGCTNDNQCARGLTCLIAPAGLGLPNMCIATAM